jgi:hypothetical protein
MPIFKRVISISFGFVTVASVSYAGALTPQETELAKLEPGLYTMDWKATITAVSQGQTEFTKQASIVSKTGIHTIRTIAPGQAPTEVSSRVKSPVYKCIKTPPIGGVYMFCPGLKSLNPDGSMNLTVSCPDAQTNVENLKVTRPDNSLAIWIIDYSATVGPSTQTAQGSGERTLSGLELVYQNAKPRTPEEAAQLQAIKDNMGKSKEQAKDSDKKQQELLLTLEAQLANVKPQDRPGLESAIARLKGPALTTTFKTQVTETITKVSSSCAGAN